MAKYIVTFFDKDDVPITEECVSCFEQDAEDVAIVAIEQSLGHTIPPYSHVDVKEVK